VHLGLHLLLRVLEETTDRHQLRSGEVPHLRLWTQEQASQIALVMGMENRLSLFLTLDQTGFWVSGLLTLMTKGS
jgi:hypothetical protein